LGLLGTNTAGKSLTYDFYFGHTGLLDIYKPETKKWFWQVYKDLHDMGASGIWGDLGEPEVHPADMKHKDAWANQVHNIYGHDWARLISEGYQKDFTRERPFILMRAGYSGSQRYGMIPWSGDVNRTWGGLKPQMEISLQMGLQGMAYMHSDLGGFAGANNDPELYVRWLQYGVFQPIFRPHAQEEVPSEAVFKDPKTKALAKAAIELRYQLLPYNYSLAFVNSTFGEPLMRPIFMEFPKANWSFNETETYMWGNAFLVHAITDSMNANAEQLIQTKLPIDAEWFDFYTGKPAASIAVRRGESNYQVAATIKTLEHLPVFVKSGAFVPMSLVLQNTELYKDTMVTLHTYIARPTTPDTTVFLWYEDDGYTKDALRLGLAKMLRCETIAMPNKATLTLSPTIAQHAALPYFEFEWLIHTNSAPKKARLNGQKCQFIYDEQAGILKLKGMRKIRVERHQQVLELTW
jgi:alpha-glucosidase (family GH31 glycosyl hydrolase)